MEPTHWVMTGLLLIGLGIPAVGFIILGRILKKDEAIDAATFLALRELRERFDRSK
jgi:mannose/fructose/N-acetylgalactosamine-specific phosphotransferase system component IIC